ncbi:hypothetical protein BDW02DRAFT_273589 [Decorospora gaudefroyi]|uniref:Uncharacterized protein n=1 Tax=Decorospora gaudefroyi TaxID=184978 RepID=A0A6A5KS80_9PLEO|nr:hypothetical protein BDW02DRAFT_273589 [Decorospora gaudefroyi]
MRGALGQVFLGRFTHWFRGRGGGNYNGASNAARENAKLQPGLGAVSCRSTRPNYIFASLAKRRLRDPYIDMCRIIMGRLYCVHSMERRRQVSCSVTKVELHVLHPGSIHCCQRSQICRTRVGSKPGENHEPPHRSRIYLGLLSDVCFELWKPTSPIATERYKL